MSCGSSNGKDAIAILLLGFRKRLIIEMIEFIFRGLEDYRAITLALFDNKGTLLEKPTRGSSVNKIGLTPDKARISSISPKKTTKMISEKRNCLPIAINWPALFF